MKKNLEGGDTSGESVLDGNVFFFFFSAHRKGVPFWVTPVSPALLKSCRYSYLGGCCCDMNGDSLRFGIRGERFYRCIHNMCIYIYIIPYVYTRWFKVSIFYVPVGGHQQSLISGHLRLYRYPSQKGHFFAGIARYIHISHIVPLRSSTRKWLNSLVLECFTTSPGFFSQGDHISIYIYVFSSLPAHLASTINRYVSGFFPPPCCWSGAHVGMGTQQRPADLQIWFICLKGFSGLFN